MSEHKPTKEQVREYLAERQRAHQPPPEINEIRKKIGWHLVQAIRKIKQRL